VKPLFVCAPNQGLKEVATDEIIQSIICNQLGKTADSAGTLSYFLVKLYLYPDPGDNETIQLASKSTLFFLLVIAPKTAFLFIIIILKEPKS
jgi:hypothetical protein